MKDFKTYLEESGEIGYLMLLNQSIAHISGLPNLKLNEIVIAEGGQRGLTQSLEENEAAVLMFETSGLTKNTAFTRTGETLKIPVNKNILGRTINPLGQPIDGLGPIPGDKKYVDLERPAPEIMRRSKVKKHFETGVMMVDLLIPLGYGQRELIIGDEKTGKTTFLLQVITNQAKKGLICIYVSIGERNADVKNVQQYFQEQRVIDQTVIVAANANQPPPLIYITPYSGMAIAEFFRDEGYNVVIILDSLTTHAKFYREISLLLKRAPGRSFYPGDIFHIQAKLLERAGNIKTKEGKEVSITALPVADTLESNIAGYIQTNLMAMTDGHIFFDSDEFKRGARPAINPFLSVSRVGNQTKKVLDKKLANFVKDRLTAYKRASDIAKFSIELPEKIKKDIEVGEKIELFLNQGSSLLISREMQILMLGLLMFGSWNQKSKETIKEELTKMLAGDEKENRQKIESKIRQINSLEELEELIKREGL